VDADEATNGPHRTEPSAGQEFAVSFHSLIRPPQNPYKLRGKGSVRIAPAALEVSGKQSRFMWFARQAVVAVPYADISDIAADSGAVTFKVVQKPAPKPVVLYFAGAVEAGAFANALRERAGQNQSESFAEEQEFKTRLAASSTRPRVVPALIAINAVVYVAVGLRGAGWMNADGRMLVEAGSNFGPLTVSGQWWRLVSSMFLHGGLIHLLVNMAALYDVGRLCERLFGNGRFLALYFASGVVGSAASVWWEPSVNSVGASGAIFGVFGALLAYMLDKRNGVPPSIMKSHQASTIVFIGYALANGMAKTGIDNAAHIGGLAAGLAVGWALARPLGSGEPARFGLRQAAGLGAAAVLAALLLGHTMLKAGPGFQLEQRFRGDLVWFDKEEDALLADTRAFFQRAKESNARISDVRPEVQKLADRWGSAHDRFAAYKLEPTAKNEALVELQTDLVNYLDLRTRALRALAGDQDHPGARDTSAQEQEFARLSKEANDAIRRMAEKAKQRNNR